MFFFRHLKAFLFNYREKILVSGLAVGSAVALYHYLQQVEENRQKLEISNFLDNVRRERYFSTICATGDSTIVSLSKKLEKEILSLLNIDCIVAELKKNPAENLKLWQTLKLTTFTQICLLIYSQTLLISTLRIQFAIMGGYLYNNLGKVDERINRELQEKYLSLCVNFIQRGLTNLRQYVEMKVSVTVDDLNLEKKLTVSSLQDIFWSIQASIDSNEFLDNIPVYLGVESSIENNVDQLLGRIYEDTINIFNTRELTSMCIKSLLHCGFTTVIEQVAKCLTTNQKTVECLPIAKLLPVLHNLMKSEASESNPSVWAQNLMSCKKLKVLATNIYESYC